MNELDKYYAQVAGQEIVDLQIPPEQGSEATTDMVAGILRRWYIVLLIFLMVCGIGLPAVWLTIKPVYNVTGAIRVDPIVADILSGGEDSGGISNYESFMNTQAEKITSNAVVQRVADDLVNKNLSFFDDEPTGLVSKWKKKLLGTNFDDEPTGLVSKWKKKLLGKPTKTEPARKLKQAIVNQEILIGARRGTELINIGMQSTNEEEAKQIVNSFIRAYMEIEVVNSDDDENRQLAILENRRDFLYEKIDNDRQTIYQLGQEYGTVALEGRQDMMLERVANLLTTLTSVEAERIKLEAQVQLLERTKEQAILPEELLKMRQDYINQDPAVVAEASSAFDELVAKETAEAGNKQLVAKRSELEQTREYEKRLQEILSQQDTQTIGIGRKQLTIQELQDRLDSAYRLWNCSESVRQEFQCIITQTWPLLTTSGQNIQ